MGAVLFLRVSAVTIVSLNLLGNVQSLLAGNSKKMLRELAIEVTSSHQQILVPLLVVYMTIFLLFHSMEPIKEKLQWLLKIQPPNCKHKCQPLLRL